MTQRRNLRYSFRQPGFAHEHQFLVLERRSRVAHCAGQQVRRHVVNASVEARSGTKLVLIQRLAHVVTSCAHQIGALKLASVIAWADASRAVASEPFLLEVVLATQMDRQQATASTVLDSEHLTRSNRPNNTTGAHVVHNLNAAVRNARMSHACQGLRIKDRKAITQSEQIRANNARNFHKHIQFINI